MQTNERVIDDRQAFEQQKRENAAALNADVTLKQTALEFVQRSDQYNYSYLWSWLGIPIIQMPADIIALQEIIWANKPDIIIETGVARGGSVLFFASMLQLLGKGQVFGIDIDIRDHNRDSIESHPFAERVSLIEGSSIDPIIVKKIKALIPENSRVMLVLDSNHTHAHVQQELELYSELVTIGQYLVIADTVIENIPTQAHRPRDWGPGNNPMTAMREFLKYNKQFEADDFINQKMLISASPLGYLKRVRM